MQLTTEVHDTLMIVHMQADRLDAAVAIEFKDNMRQIAQGGPARVVLDLSEVQFLDSSGLGAVVASMKLLAPDHRLELAGLTPTVAKVFKLTCMDRVFAIHETSQGAVASASDVA
ncbi:STAS domain-containing protein [Actibacterium sp. 188UL27-1]|uniref:STAS domain-containing protein n=1 Tax=Actibacterium sp. 188UL27-1 TaxID=2786961 RepID=UPI00195A7E4C|nr:STAS domain-containing protein [Actibacterium sp. 188UL27-1]MBM7066021.1 STAS domain-containing protein [Actibacterium sp. 188UL27-1]